MGMARCLSGLVSLYSVPPSKPILSHSTMSTRMDGGYLRYDRAAADKCIVIVLIAAEILVAAINIVVDLYAGID